MDSNPYANTKHRFYGNTIIYSNRWIDRDGNYRYRYTYPTDDSSGTLATDPAAIARNGRECVGLGADETKE